jgi:hypothetical protein
MKLIGALRFFPPILSYQYKKEAQIIVIAFLKTFGCCLNLLPAAYVVQRRSTHAFTPRPALPGVCGSATRLECRPHGSVTPQAKQATKYVCSWK